MSKGYYEETSIDCPVCGGKRTFVLRQHVYNIPNQGETLIVGGKCGRCGYRLSWSVPLVTGEPRTMELTIQREDELNTLVYVGENARIEFPDIGAEITVGEETPGFITTVEGLLLRLKEAFQPHCSNDCSVLNRIDELLDLKKPFKVKLHDKEGRSRILSKIQT